jgi:hypothetical protein
MIWAPNNKIMNRENQFALRTIFPKDFLD